MVGFSAADGSLGAGAAGAAGAWRFWVTFWEFLEFLNANFQCEFLSELVGGFKLKLIEVPNSELDCDFWEVISVDCQLDWFSL